MIHVDIKMRNKLFSGSRKKPREKQQKQQYKYEDHLGANALYILFLQFCVNHLKSPELVSSFLKQEGNHTHTREGSVPKSPIYGGATMYGHC